VREIDGTFVDFARTISLVHTGRGTTLTMFSTNCVMFEGGILREALEAGSGAITIEGLVRAALAGGTRVAWCTHDCIVHSGDAIAKSLVELRPAVRA
jgi:hypothetical protein